MIQLLPLITPDYIILCLLKERAGDMKSKILTVILIILILIGIGGCFYFWNRNQAINSAIAEISSESAETEKAAQSKQADISKSQEAITEAEKNRDELSAKKEEAEKAFSDKQITGNGYSLENFEAITVKVAADKVEVFKGASDEYEVSKELSKDDEIIIDAKATYTDKAFYRIKGTETYVNADAVEGGK